MPGNNSENKRKNISDSDDDNREIKKIKTLEDLSICTAIGENLSGEVFSHTAKKPVAIVTPRCKGQAR